MANRRGNVSLALEATGIARHSEPSALTNC